MSQPKPVSRVVAAASQLGLEITVSEFPDGTRTADDAARAVGCLVDQIVKSMIFDAEGTLVLALTSGAHQVDGARLASRRTRLGFDSKYELWYLCSTPSR